MRATPAGPAAEPPAVLSPWCPHPLQEAGAHPLWRFQATLQVLEEDPEQGEEISSGTACLGALRVSVRACVCLACCETGKSRACFQTGHPSGCAEQRGGGWTWTGPPSPPCSPGRRGKEGEWMEDGRGTRRNISTDVQIRAVSINTIITMRLKSRLNVHIFI